jgi:hypothetical protein
MLEGLLFWSLHLIPIVLFAVPAWYLGRNRVKWNVFDFATIFVPYAAWFTLMVIEERGKGLGNYSMESLVLGFAAAFASAMRLQLGRRKNEQLLSIFLLIGLCIFGALLWAFVPPSRE